MKITIYEVRKGVFLPPYIFGASNHAEVKKGICEYWIKGEGWKKTQKFNTKEIELPDTKDNIKDIVSCINLYGCHVAMLLITNNAECWRYHKNRTAQSIAKMLGNDIDTFPAPVVNAIEFNWELSFFGCMLFDPLKFDENLSKIDKEYDNVKCTWKGVEISLHDYLVQKYGLTEAQIDKLKFLE